MEYCHFVNVDPETKQERMHHITPDFPYGADLCDLHIFPGNMFPWHWHRELEVFYMRRGSLTYHLPCGAVTFSQGEGGFINSNILHKTTCAPEDACIQEEQQFSPEFVGVNSLLLRKYVQPIVSSSELPFVKLDPSTAAHRPLLELLCGCYRLYEENNPVYCGKISYGRRRTEKIDGTRNEFHVVKQDKESYKLYQGQHEAIIDEAQASSSAAEACDRYI